jgi:LuxR family maltose regulon positive regulatory protein
MQMLEGEYNGAKDTINAASGIVRLPSGKPSPIACEVYLLDGVYSYELNDLDRAEESIRESIQLNTAQRIIELQYGGRVWLSRVLRAKGDLSGAIEQIERAEQLATRAKLWRFQAHTSAIRAELSTFLGDIERARHWASNLDKSRTSRPVELPRMDEFEDIILAHVYLAMKMPDCIPDLLKSRLVKAESSGRMDSVYRMTAYLGLAQAEIGDMDRALENMKWLLPKVAVQGYTRLFLDCGREMADLLRQMNVAGIEPAYTRQLLVAFSEDSLMGENQHPPLSLLSNREQEVLILISAGYSNREIADELVITMGTVKRHVSNIYHKLNVNSRTQALAAARELHLMN